MRTASPRRWSSRFSTTGKERGAMAVLRELELESQVSVRGEPQPGFPVEPNTTAGRALWLGPDEWLGIGGGGGGFPGGAAVVGGPARRDCVQVRGDAAGA